MEKILKMLEKQKVIIRKYENNLIKLNVEVFRSVDSYENYAVSSFGRVKNTKTGRILKTGDNGRGYLTVNLCEDGVKKTHRIHRLVANAFINNPNDKEQVDHIDNNRTNNYISNLRFATIKENSRNSSIRLDNTSGHKGVCFDKKAKKWKAHIMIDGVQIHIGYYDDLEDAKIARFNRANEAFGVFVNACEQL
jgi:hypothetical protein